MIQDNYTTLLDALRKYQATVHTLIYTHFKHKKTLMIILVIIIDLNCKWWFISWPYEYLLCSSLLRSAGAELPITTSTIRHLSSSVLANTLRDMKDSVCFSVQGQRCDMCSTPLHFSCANKLFANKPTPRCPRNNCSAPWPIIRPSQSTGKSFHKVT